MVVATLILFGSLRGIFGQINSNYIVASSGTINYGTFPSKLHIEGRYIKDDSGNTIILRGVNRAHFVDLAGGAWGGWWDEDGYSIFKTLQVQKELDAMKSWGLNVLRLSTCIQYWKENTNIWMDGDTSKTHIDAIKYIIVEAAKRGIYVVYSPWNVADARGEELWLPFPPYSLTQDPNSTVISSEQDFIDYWVDVSRELRTYPNVIYEILNEPHGDAQAQGDWYRVWNDVINAIRTDGDDNIIVVQWGYGVFWSSDGNHIDLQWIWDFPFNQTNILYSTHVYRYWSSFGNVPYNPYEYELIKQRAIDLKFNAVGEELNKSLWIGEIGASIWWVSDPVEYEKEKQYFNNTLFLFDEWSTGYCAWEWWTGTQWSLNVNLWDDPSLNEMGEIFVNSVERGKNILD